MHCAYIRIKAHAPIPRQCGGIGYIQSTLIEDLTAVKPFFHSSQKPTRRPAASAFKYCDYNKSSRSESAFAMSRKEPLGIDRQKLILNTLTIVNPCSDFHKRACTIVKLQTVADTSRNIGGSEIFNMYAFGVGLRYANLSNIMLGISNSLFDILL